MLCAPSCVNNGDKDGGGDGDGTDVDVTDDDLCEGIAAKITGGPIDILINNAGYFYEPVEKIDSLNFKEVGAGSSL